MSSIEKLLEVMANLRDPETGCPWDVEQDFTTIAPYTVEEAYEVADAIARDDMDDLRDELGDLLLQVVFHARMAEEAGCFDFDAVVAAITDKMIRRHPHVFGTEEERRRGPAAGAWERIKAEERADKRPTPATSQLDGVAIALPALKRAEKLGKRAASVGFDWPEVAGVRAKIDEELRELDAATDSNAASGIEEELGDLLFTVANLARRYRIDPEHALSRANQKFERRFRSMESAAAAADESLESLDIEALESRWQAAKRRS
jgi:MazG family protein